MNMLTIDPNPPNPISSFLKAITLDDSNNPPVLPIIANTDLDLSDLCLDGIFMYQQDDQPTVEEDDVLHPPPPPPIFPPPRFVPDNQTRLTYSSMTYSKHYSLLMMLLLPSGMKSFLTCTHGVLLNSMFQIPQLPK